MLIDARIVSTEVAVKTCLFLNNNLKIYVAYDA